MFSKIDLVFCIVIGANTYLEVAGNAITYASLPIGLPLAICVSRRAFLCNSERLKRKRPVAYIERSGLPAV